MVDNQLKDILTDLGNQTVPKDIEALAQDINNRFVDDLSQQKLAHKTLKLWETIMRSKWTKLAAVVVVMVSVMAVLFSNWSTRSAYALEQTLEALHSVRYLHMKLFHPPLEEPKEFWFTCDAQGEIIQARWHLPAWENPNAGSKVVVWKDGKAEVWFKKKNVVTSVWEQVAIEKMKKMLIDMDPKTRVQKYLRLEEQGRVTLEFDEPQDKSRPITVTAVYQDNPGLRDVLIINQATLLVEKMERYINQDDEDQLREVHEFHAYNQPIDETMFKLQIKGENIHRFDKTAADVGMAQGDLSDQAIAEKVVRGFFEALIAEDYATAGRLYGGLKGDYFKKMFAEEGINFTRIIELGPAHPHPDPETRGWVVPLTVEANVRGELGTDTSDTIAVRPVHGQPDRWAIFGGF